MKKKICFSILLFFLACSTFLIVGKRCADGTDQSDESREISPGNLPEAELIGAQEPDEPVSLTFTGNDSTISALTCPKEEFETIKKERIWPLFSG